MINDELQAIIESSQFYIMSQNYREAIELLENALKKYGESYEIYYNLGLAYESLSMVNEAVKSYRKSLKLNPQFLEAKKRLDSLIGE